MYVGVILAWRPRRDHTTRIPHVCGGDPTRVVLDLVRDAYSPCMWG